MRKWSIQDSTFLPIFLKCLEYSAITWWYCKKNAANNGYSLYISVWNTFFEYENFFVFFIMSYALYTVTTSKVLKLQRGIFNIKQVRFVISYTSYIDINVNVHTTRAYTHVRARTHNTQCEEESIASHMKLCCCCVASSQLKLWKRNLISHCFIFD